MEILMTNLFFRNIIPVFLLFISSVVAINAQKMTAEEVVSKHLESIGEKRAEIKNQLIVSDVRVIQKGSAQEISGKALILSSGEKNLWGMNLSSNDYPQDRFGFNGKNTKVGYVIPAARSALGDFIYSYNEILNQGLLGGTLSNSWALLKNDAKSFKVSYEGTKKIDGRETHVISYNPRGGSDLSIKMYFDKQNFQHLRTEYNRVIAASQGSSIDNSAGQGEDRYRLIEDFSEFKKMGNLMLPSKYKISYSYSSSAAIRTAQKRNREMEWNFDIKTYSFNQSLDENSFNIEAN
jgi:hypothetical protein